MNSTSTCEDEDTDNLDPRIQIELEKLNNATDKINRLETELDEATTVFRTLLNESTQLLKQLAKKLGSCIEKARPYYEAVEVARQAQLECQRAAVQFQRTNGIHKAAKETVALAEQRFLSKRHEWQFDNAWQEMLNHATLKVVEAEAQKAESEKEHMKRAVLFNAAEQKVQYLEQKLQRNIVKSRQYFEEKDVCQKRLNAQKDLVESLQRAILCTKQEYARSLHQLESISEEIHEKRRMLAPREPGVGAELSPVPTDCEFNLDRWDRCDAMSSASVTTAASSATVSDVEDDVDDPEDVEDLRKKVRDLSMPPAEGKVDQWDEFSATVNKLTDLLKEESESNTSAKTDDGNKEGAEREEKGCASLDDR